MIKNQLIYTGKQYVAKFLYLNYDTLAHSVKENIWINNYIFKETVLIHYGIKGQKWGVKNGPPYPIENSQKSGKINIKIPEEKFTEYALNPEKCPYKAIAFKLALGYTKENYKELSDNINKHFDEKKLEERGDNGYGMKYQQVMWLIGANGKEANVLTAWIKENEENIRLVTTYITDKEESK